MGPTMEAISREWDRAWLISSVENTNPHGFPGTRNATLTEIGQSDPIKSWLDARYVRLEERAFVGVWMTLYDLQRR
jgi:hypothetical protein